MIITILAVLLTVIPFLLLAYFETRWQEERERKRKAGAKARKIKAIEARWPFVSVPELYYYKRNTDPGFKEPCDGKTLHKLRIRHAREIRRITRKGG